MNCSCAIRRLGTVIRLFNKNVFLSTALDFTVIIDGEFASCPETG
jgi:hypothetical protein